MLAAFVIFLREGTEASIIVAILCSYLDRTGQRRHFRDVFVGVGLAAGLAAGGGFAAYYTIHSYSGSRVQTIFETATYLVAVVVLTYMTFWMRRHARSMSRDLASRAEGALGRRERYGLGLLAFQAVGREGLETAVFTLAIVFAAGTHGTLLGAAGGLACALAFSFAVFRLGRRVNLGIFFTVVGTVLMVFAAGLVADVGREPPAARLGPRPVGAPLGHEPAAVGGLLDRRRLPLPRRLRRPADGVATHRLPRLRRLRCHRLRHPLPTRRPGAAVRRGRTAPGAASGTS